MTRIRLIYEKRGGACFVPHIALAQLFSRAARRAGISLASTGGFSPRGKMSFGPELPAGVVALNEPVDLWLAEPMPAEEAPDLAQRFDNQMPDGFRVKECLVIAEGAQSLGKDCKAAQYLIWARNNNPTAEKLSEHIKTHFAPDVQSAEIIEAINETPIKQDSQGATLLEQGLGQSPRLSTRLSNRLYITLADPAKNGIGSWVKALTAAGIIAGWQDICIVRQGLCL